MIEKDIYEKLAELLRNDQKVAVATVVDTGGSHPRDLGAKMLILPNGEGIGTVGGGKVEQMVMEDAVSGMEKGAPFSKHYSLTPESQGGVGMECGGDILVFFEYPQLPSTLLVCGAGHIAHSLVPMADMAGFSVVVADPRPEFATRERFPDAREVVCISMDDPALRRKVDKNTHVVIITHQHSNDLDALVNLTGTGAAYIGMIGSRRKVRTLLDRLEESGADRSDIDRIFAPIGLDISAETPAEIAVSILAELVAFRRTGNASSLSMREMGENG